MSLKEQILEYSRQKNIGPLSPWFDAALDRNISLGKFIAPDDFSVLRNSIVTFLSRYREETGAKIVVLGMSGGVDSALTASLFRMAGYGVIGVTMPIHQAQEETDRGVEACMALRINHVHKDLSALYDALVDDFGHSIDFDVGDVGMTDDKATKIRRGNIRARLRMITLYNIASLNGGFVASTDNLSELTAGFWTLHGDVGDVSPIQSLWKSWEVPFLASISGVPESTWRAKPTDGLGVDDGDEAQLGASYLEWDLMTMALDDEIGGEGHANDLLGIREKLGLDARAEVVFDSVTRRMKGSWYKWMNPVNIPNPFENRYFLVDFMDEALFRPDVVKKT